MHAFSFFSTPMTFFQMSGDWVSAFMASPFLILFFEPFLNFARLDFLEIFG
jgi:hypothetical protein